MHTHSTGINSYGKSNAMEKTTSFLNIACRLCWFNLRRTNIVFGANPNPFYNLPCCRAVKGDIGTGVYIVDLDHPPRVWLVRAYMH